MDKLLKIEIRTAYGNERMYALTHVQEVTTLTGSAVLDEKQVATLEQMGYVPQYHVKVRGKLCEVILK